MASNLVGVASADGWWVNVMSKDFSQRKSCQRVAAWGLTDYGTVVPLAVVSSGIVREVETGTGSSDVLQLWHEDGTTPPPMP